MQKISFNVRGIIETMIALLAGIAASSILILVYGYDPLAAFYWLFYGGFGSLESLLDTLGYATPLILTGVAFGLCFKGGIFNVGVEGQAYMGAIGAIVFGGLLPRLFPPLAPLSLVLALAGSLIFGIAWALPPALLKAYRGVHEVISTIMLNWIAYNFVMFLVRGPLVNPSRPEMSMSVVESARFSVVPGSAVLTSAILVSLAAAVLTYLLLTLTRLGFEIRVTGSSIDAARYSGVNYGYIVIVSFVLSGALSGLAGGLVITGRPPVWALYGTLGNIMNIGFDGIGVALIGRSNPLAIILSGVFIGGLWNGSRLMEPYSGVCSELSRAIIGLIVIALSVPELLRRISRVMRR
jgi:simple sugar transport system permease protein